MSKMKDFYRIVSPSTSTTLVSDNQLLDTGVSATSNFTWYHKLVQGSGARLSRYNEYNIMDNDVEVSRALDIIAEEMTGYDKQDDLPFEIKILADDSSTVDDAIVVTLKAAVRHWSKIHGFDANRLFKIARNTIKYGDCVFKKHSNFKKWEWVPMTDVTGAFVSEEDVTEVVGYQLRVGSKAPMGSGIGMNSNMQNMQAAKYGSFSQTENLTKDQLVVFSINDDMSESAPFGESVLRTAYKTHKQKELLEDAIIIYRIQRAPERRVFYIDVGKMSPHRVKAYLETMKNELRQKKMPSTGINGQSSVDATYNPQSTMEDLFIAQRCIALDTLIDVPGIGALTLFDIINRYNDGQRLRVHTIDQDSGELVVGTVSWAGVTKRDTEVYGLTFSNGKYLECTPDHKLLLKDRTEIEAQNLKIDDLLCTGTETDIYVIKVEKLLDVTNTGCLTVETVDNNHNFRLSSGIYIKNSDGVGSKVEVLPGGSQLGELSDLSYFRSRLLLALRVPKSWLGNLENDGGTPGIFNDGKIGAAYIEEQQFAKFVERLQIYISSVLDEEFKKFLFSSNINIDINLFELKLPKPSNYEKYKQADIDSALLGTIGSADGITWLSKRWIGKRYLQMTEDELLENEKLIKQERGLPEDTKNLKDIYGPQAEPGMEGDMGVMGGMGGDLGGIGGDLGGGTMASSSDLSLGGPSEPGASAPPSGSPTAATPAPSL
jgi:hypothetical protein